jgi:hypothetical protein
MFFSPFSGNHYKLRLFLLDWKKQMLQVPEGVGETNSPECKKTKKKNS